MPNLRESANHRMRSIWRRDRQLPSYWAAIQIAVGVILVVFIGFQFLTNDSTTSSYRQLTPDEFLGRVDTPATTVPGSGSGPTTPTTAGPGTGVTVAIPSAAGGVTDVPESALLVGVRAASAAFGGDASGLQLSPGTQIPQLIPRDLNPTVTNPTLISTAGNSWVFLIEVRSGLAGSLPQTVTITVSGGGGNWQVAYS